MSRLRQRAALAEKRKEHTMPDAAGPMPEGAKKGKSAHLLPARLAAPRPDPPLMLQNLFAVSRMTLGQPGRLASGHGR